MKKLILSLGVLLLYVVLFSTTASAQGNSVCKGNVEGLIAGGNTNNGNLSFDAHDRTGLTADDRVNLSILGLAEGLAPGEKGNAACTEYLVDQPGYDHALKGWAWSDNLGFISFSCEGGKNRSGLVGGGAACGPINYGVKLSTPDAGGNRALKGYAWNSTFGWMQFDNAVFPGQAVKVNAGGYASGYAWTSAGIWVNFTGVRLEVYPDPEMYALDDGEEDFVFDFLEDIEPPVADEWCDGRAFLCAEVAPSPGALDLRAIGEQGVKYADGVEGYMVHLYLKDALGAALDPADFESITLVWDDTVKANQTNNSSVGDSLDNLARPWTQSLNGGVKFKPVSFANDFVPVAGDPGHYVSVAPVTSYAPTTGENISYTVGTDPAYPFNNETFIYDAGVPALDEENRLILKRIEYGAYDDGVIQRPAGSALPNGSINGVNFRFKPAINVETLYSGILEDVINAYRGVAVTITSEVKASRNLDPGTRDTAVLNYRLHYAGSAEEIEDAQRCQQADFNFHFLEDVNGEPLEDNNISILGPNVRDVIDRRIELQAVATLPVIEPVEGEESPLPCAFAEAPSLFTVVRYFPSINKSVNHYSNKLPKTPGNIVNPSIVVHGNIFGQNIGNVSDKNSVTLVGNPAVDVVRDTIVRNLEKYVGGAVTNVKQGNSCTIRSLKTVDANGFSVGGASCNAAAYKVFVIGNENVLYFKNQDVRVDLQSGGTTNRWVIVADGGNIYIDNSINNDDETNKRVVLVALRNIDNIAKYFSTGHGYLVGGKSMIVDATMIFDGSLFPYVDDLALDAKGAPVWPDAATKAQALNYQLLVRGAIYSDNTIGGADLDGGNDPKNYLLAGAGEVINLPASNEDRIRAQGYDLNYLRMFTLAIETCPNGLPKDQVCGACLSTDEIIAIASGATVCGEKGNCRPDGAANQLNACNGINPFEKYDGSATATGDLVPPQDQEFVVPDGFEPVYVYYRAPAKDSFVFSGR